MQPLLEAPNDPSKVAPIWDNPEQQQDALSTSNPPALPLRCVRVHMLCSPLSLKPELGGSSAQDPRDERGALKMRRTSHLGAPTATAPDRSKPRQRAPAHIASLYQARMHVKYVLSPH